ncbi:hypothetical protein BDW68DRAFT_38719 [Aspergillus falconensis]
MMIYRIRQFAKRSHDAAQVSRLGIHGFYRCQLLFLFECLDVSSTPILVLHIYLENDGAYTGLVSPPCLQSMGGTLKISSMAYYQGSHCLYTHRLELKTHYKSLSASSDVTDMECILCAGMEAVLSRMLVLVQVRVSRVYSRWRAFCQHA